MKAGYKTTEFWLTAVVNLAVFVGIMTAQEGSEALLLIGAAVAAIVDAAYIFGRSAIKVRTAVQEQGVTEIELAGVDLDYDDEAVQRFAQLLKDTWIARPDDWQEIAKTMLAKIQADINEALHDTA